MNNVFKRVTYSHIAGFIFVYSSQTLTMRYLVYRNRGSVATYIHEAKVTCEVGEKTKDHRILTEMVLYLKRDDELFISVGDEDKGFLSTESGSHVIGLFEI